MEKIELPIRLRKSRWKIAGLLLISSIFVAIGCWMTKERPLIAYSSIAFFGLGMVVFTIELLSDSSYLELSEQGFVCCTLFRRQKLVPWSNIAGFGWIKVHRKAMLAYSLKPDPAKPPKKIRLSNVIMAGWDGVLPDTYGMRPEKLVDFMSFMAAEYGLGPQQPEA